MNVKETFSKNFNKAIVVKGLGKYTNVELGRYFGVSSVTAYKYKTGEKLPGMENAVIFANKLEVSLDWLLANKGSFESPANDGEPAISSNSKVHSAKVQYLVDILEQGNIDDKGFKTLIKAFTDIIDLIYDVEKFTFDHKDDREEDRRDPINRPFWKLEKERRIN